eukprot:COSAG02_NODE_19870_length_860_cov_224.980289_1_plen_80_part_01
MGTHHNSPPPLATSVPTLPGTPLETQPTHHACSQGRGSSSTPAGAHPPSCAAAGGDVPGQGFHWAPAVTAAVAGTLSAPV